MATFTNQASLTYNGVTINSNIVTGELNQTLCVGKTATVDSYSPGELLTYVVSIRNTGGMTYTGLTVSDDLGAYRFCTEPEEQTLTPLTYTGDPILYYIDGALQAAPEVMAGPPLTITGISAPAGSDVILIYRVLVNAFAPPLAGGCLVNTVTVGGCNLAEAVTATHSLCIECEPRLSILKSLEPSSVADNARITYTFLIQNSSAVPVTAEADAVVRDVFSPILEGPLAVTLNGDPLLPSYYSYTATTGVFSTDPGAVTVPAATFTRDPATGAYTIVPGVTTLTVTGII